MGAAKGSRNTRQRQVILDELRRMGSHPTATLLYDAVRRRDDKISLATVYRNLEVLEDAGSVQRLQGVGHSARFDGDMSDHCHVRCVRCGDLGDVARPQTGLLKRNFTDLAGYKILGFHLEFTGVCPNCQE